MLTKQQLFNNAWHGIIAQGGASFKFRGVVGDKNPANGCFYRAPDGRKCAIGHSIPDSAYKTDLESLGIEDLVEMGVLKLDAKDTAIFAGQLQLLHDGKAQHYGPNTFLLEWKDGMRRLATTWKLEVPNAE